MDQPGSPNGIVEFWRDLPGDRLTLEARVDEGTDLSHSSDFRISSIKKTPRSSSAMLYNSHYISPGLSGPINSFIGTIQAKIVML